MRKLKITLHFEFREEDFQELMDNDELTLEEAVQQELEDGNIELGAYVVGQEQSEVVDE
jgi:hypothetical protein